MPRQGDKDRAEPEPEHPRPLGKQSSVSDLVRNYDGNQASEDGQGKRDRSESGDPQPRAWKRGALDRHGERISPPHGLSGEFKAKLDDAMEDIETRLTSLISRELHDFKMSINSQFEALETRIHDLEQHVEMRDCEIDRMSQQLQETREEMEALRSRAEDAEMISRLPCLVLSGKAMAPRRRAPPLDAPLPTSGTARSADISGPGRTGPPPARSDGRSGDPEQHGGGGSRTEDREDINSLVVRTLNNCFPDLQVEVRDIDRAHRLPGPNNRVIVRFVRSGPGSIRDVIMWRRLELKGRDLFVGESLTHLRGKIFRSLLEAKKKGNIHTVYTRGGQVFFKPEKFAVGQRVDSIQKLSQLGFSVVTQ